MTTIEVDLTLVDAPTLNIGLSVEGPSFGVAGILPTGPRGPRGLGPAGGTTGQVAVKLSDTDYDIGWTDADFGGGGGASSVAELTDVDLTGLEDGHGLAYDELEEIWKVAAFALDADLDTETAARIAGDTAAVQRANHTGTQPQSSIDGLVSDLAGKQAASAHLTAIAAAANSTVLAATTASYTTAEATKLGHLTVTQAVDLDTIEARVNQLDAAVVLRGAWDASAGTFPGGGTAQAGDSYIVSVAGTVGGVVFSVNDRVLAIADNASTTVYANNWLKLDYTDQVLSVDGQTGAVNLSSVYQPLDGDLTAIAALSTQTFGRSLLTAVDAAAARTALELSEVVNGTGIVVGPTAGGQTPIAIDSTVVTLAGIQTLTNKSLTSPALTGDIGIHAANPGTLSNPLIIFGSASPTGSQNLAFMHSATSVSTPGQTLANSVLMRVTARGYTDAGAYSSGAAASIQATADQDVTASARGARLDFRVTPAGGTTLTEALRINSVAVPQVLALDGAVGAPAWSFINDPDTGIYRSASDVLRLAVGGVSGVTVGLLTSLPTTYAQLTTGSLNLDAGGTITTNLSHFDLTCSNTILYSSASVTSAQRTYISIASPTRINSSAALASVTGFSFTPPIQTTAGAGAILVFAAMDLAPVLVGPTVTGAFGLRVRPAVSSIIPSTVGTLTYLDISPVPSSGFITGSTTTTTIGLSMTGLLGNTVWGLQIGDFQSFHEGRLRIGATTPASPTAPQARLEIIDPVPVNGTEHATPIHRLQGVTSAGGDVIVITKQNLVLTTNATITTAAVYTIPTDTTMTVKTTVVARRDDSSSGGTVNDGAAYHLIATFKEVAGVCTQIGATTVLATHESQAGWDCVFDVSGATARVRVTGALNNFVYWHVTSEIFYSSS